jgi:hypothetical protein
VAKSALRTRKKPVGPVIGNPKPNMKGLVPHRFGKGNPGKKPGTKNKMGVKLKEAILEAAERSGRDGKGKDGAVGYLVWLSRTEPAVFGRMLEKIMPMQLDVRDKTNAMTPGEAVDNLRERGLPVPPSLIDLAEDVGRAVIRQQDEDDDGELDGPVAPDDD